MRYFGGDGDRGLTLAKSELSEWNAPRMEAMDWLCVRARRVTGVRHCGQHGVLACEMAADMHAWQNV